LRREVSRRLVFFQHWTRDKPPFSPTPELPPLEALDPTQRRVLEYIKKHPGVHLRQICRELSLAMGDVQYHIRRLERDGRINSIRRGIYKFFYPSTLFGVRQRDVLSVLGLEMPRELLLNIVEKPGSTQEELAHATSVSQSTVSWHLKRLVDLGIIERRQQGRAMEYTVVGSSVEIAEFIKAYHPTVWERWSSRLADIFIAYSGGDGGDKK
jgi:predicted transcriptional regulator